MRWPLSKLTCRARDVDDDVVVIDEHRHVTLFHADVIHSMPREGLHLLARAVGRLGRAVVLRVRLGHGAVGVRGLHARLNGVGHGVEHGGSMGAVCVRGLR